MAAKSMLYRVAWQAARGGTSRKEVHALASAVKLVCSETAGRVVDKAVQILGGRGYMRENPVERLYRELRVDRIWEGTSEIQRMVIGNELRKRGHGPIRAGRPGDTPRNAGPAERSSRRTDERITVGVDVGGTKIQAAAVRGKEVAGSFRMRDAAHRRADDVRRRSSGTRSARPLAEAGAERCALRRRRDGASRGPSTPRPARSRTRRTCPGSRRAEPVALGAMVSEGARRRAGRRSTTTCGSRSSASGSAAPGAATGTCSACGSAPASAAV